MRTTLDSRLQSLARASLMEGLESYDHRHGWRGAWGHAEPGQDWQAIAKARPRPWERREWRAAMVDSASGAGARVTTVDGDEGELDGGDRRLGQRRQGAQDRRSRLRGASGREGQAIQPAPDPNGQRRHRRLGAAVGPRPGDGGRLQLLAVQVQSRHPGQAPARLLVQAVRLRDGAGERLHAGRVRCWTRRST